MADLPRVKICGLTRGEDARAADRAGADYVGVVLSHGFGRSVDPDQAARVVEGVGAVRVAVLVDEDADGAVVRARAVEAGVLQLHGEEEPALVRELQQRGPWKLWKSVRVRGPGDVSRAVDAFGDLVDGLLLEGFRPGVVGGGGVAADPDALREVRLQIPRGITFVLAGGLTPDTVADAVARVAPDVVDVSSGVEQVHGRKDHDLIRRFIEAARGMGTPPSGDLSRP
jgi:phosphoribosylanthranilate isomerase